MKALARGIVLAVLFWIATPMLFAQEELPTDDLGNVSDVFQEAFFEALKQKAILNFEKALEALDSAESAAGDNIQQQAIVYFERGKNYYALRKFPEAETAYLASQALEPENQQIAVSLYDVYYQTKEYTKAIEVVKRLIEFDPDYKEDLANLYVRTEQYDPALEVLNELDAEFGRSRYRENLRKQIIRATGDTATEIVRLEENTTTNPNNESDYLNLIYLYSESGDVEKAFQTAEKMQGLFPESELVHLALYKFYLNKNEPEKAATSMQIVMNSRTIDSESKSKVMLDFIVFSEQNPNYQETLNSAIKAFADSSTNPRTLERLGGYYLSKGEQEQALTYFKRGLTLAPEDFPLIKNTLLLQLDTKKYQDALSLGESALEIYPTQALLYLIQGVALVELDNANKAVSLLEEGLDYVIEDPVMEKDFYEQLSLAYERINNTQKASEYAKKAKDLG